LTKESITKIRNKKIKIKVELLINKRITLNFEQPARISRIEKTKKKKKEEIVTHKPVHYTSQPNLIFKLYFIFFKILNYSLVNSNLIVTKKL